MHILGWIIVGALAGWIASLVVQSKGQGCIVNIALGLVGAVVGGFLFRQLGGFSYDGTGFVASTFVAVIGAVIVLLLWNAIRRR
ncbi:MAG TPA: GlsB/YeaQ/YmgE family stress response membrane protein [Rhizomicrobium sp.]|nr:GlsB/YeaQ/YmgE family stress response membrane protein [Rhizomicrobium sp.]